MTQDTNLRFVFAHFSAPWFLNIFGILLVLVIVVRIFIVQRLYRNHRATWTSLGSPKIFGSGVASKNLLKFIGARGHFRDLEDKTLNVIVYVNRAAVAAAILTFCAAVIFALVNGK